MEYFKICEGIPVYITDTEKGEKCIVLLHGYLETSAVWENFTDLLKSEYRVITLDLPGNGLSGTHETINSMEFMADVVSCVLKHAGVETATIVGHSMGGYAALAFAEKYDTQTEKLCLFHSTPNADTDEKKQNREREINLIKEDKLQVILNVNVKNMFAKENEKKMADTIEMIKENATISDSTGIIACLRGMMERKDMNSFLSGFKKPLLFIFGKKDNYIPESVALELIEKFPEADSILLENSGHAGFFEEPQICANKLLNLP